MSESDRSRSFLDGARVDDAVFRLRPDYRALLASAPGLAVATRHITPGTD